MVSKASHNVLRIVARYLGLGMCASFMAAAAGVAAADLLIEDVTVLSPERPQPLRNRHVLIRDERIVAVSDRAIAVKPGTQRLAGRGKFLTPGLMDSHVHVSTPAGMPFSNDDASLAGLRSAYVRQQPRSYLYFGVTQVVDLGGLPDGVAAFEAQPQRPDLFRCGTAPVLDGYPAVFMDKAVRYTMMPDYIFEPANAARHPLPVGADASMHTPAAVVARLAANGARCIKVFIEDGFGDQSDWPIMSRATLKSVLAAARSKNLLVIAHANALNMQRMAAEIPADVIAHGLWNWDAAAGKPGVPEIVAVHLRNVHAQRIGFQPTLRVLPGTADLFRADTLQDPVYAKVVPAELLAWYGTSDGQWFKRQMKADYGGIDDNKIIQQLLKTADHGTRTLQYLYQLGHPLLLGSDTPSAPTYGNQPGYDTYRELRLMAQAGIALAAIFQAGTINNARQFRLDKDYGTVESGKIANLLLLDANPLETVRAWSLIDKIILRGAVIKRASLAADRLNAAP